MDSEKNSGEATDVDGVDLEGDAGIDWEGDRLAGERDERW
jgi:hypothetical protein